MRPSIVLAIAGLVTTVSLWTLWPRLDHTFPSMVDDWAAISRSPDQIGEALTLRNPEDGRYRPTWIVWNYLQWHTLGAPEALRPPVAWELLRVLTLVSGMVVAAVALTQRAGTGRIGTLNRSILVGGAVVAVVTIPEFAVDLARYGPQEPLMVGLMCGGAALYWFAAHRALQGKSAWTTTVLLGVGAALLWWAGVGQKESSICALALIPFLWLAVRRRKKELEALPTATRRALWATIGLAGVAFIPVLARTVQLALADERIYGARPEERIFDKATRQLTEMDVALNSRTGWYLLGGALVLTAAVSAMRRIDWLGIGLLVTAFAFLVFASSTAILASRYYLPTVALASLALARAASAFPIRRTTVLATALLVLGLWQAPAARDSVERWIGWESGQEAIVREVARTEASGCRVEVTGPDIEFVEALPVLLPLAREEPGDCTPGDTFVAVLTGTSPWAEKPDDPPVVACGVSAVVVFQNEVGRVMRCSRA